ncbi:glycosyl transferase family protein [Basidiobolus meristosporus CBS 931.73]|uniref:Glycosyl transferase family protein n=1 Tax=Basidiobolus meristosporus CBS 931.73 TaxID=1314790 RepID=A0A1Y1YR44_9FUNG|nr:glycosyl transferase family protein [Basidiobolus meristosporus CBS 931.73]|eukprot:ORY00500.1 glycosyl transferase family protein [Basidiobolus meristosporus CBS 931.73]
MLNSLPRYAWVTLLTRDQFFQGVRVLARSLKKSNSIYPIVVIHTSNVSQQNLELLSKEGCLIRLVDFVDPQPNRRLNYIWERYADTWTKLQAWNLTDYERVTLLDADMLVLKNMDEVFDVLDQSPLSLAAANACTCNPFKQESYPKHWIPAHCAHTIYENAATSNIDASVSKGTHEYFNSGLLVLAPSQNLFQRMVRELNKTQNLDRYTFPDQDFLNEIFRHSWIPLPYIYNALKPMKYCHPKMWSLADIKNIHYILEKPWDVDLTDRKSLGPFDDLYKLWWDVQSELS